MTIDVPTIRLVGEGVQAETEGRADDAAALFRQAWEEARDDYEACVAAHFVARHQSAPEDVLRWNQECLERADRVGDERVRGFYPSLHASLALAHQELGAQEQARQHYRRAAESIDDAAAGPYQEGIRFTIAAGLRSTGAQDEDPGPLPDLLTRLCARADLTALGLLLPPYLGDLGTAEDRTRLLTALQMVHASRKLPEDEQALLREVMIAQRGS